MSEAPVAENESSNEPKKLDRFEVPNRLIKNEDTATEGYAQFEAEPFERGFGHTIGNSLRRVLLSSLEGAAITSVRIAGVQHEFSTLPGVVEDVTEIVLNLKKVKFRHHDKEHRVLSIKVEKAGVVTAADIDDDNVNIVMTLTAPGCGMGPYIAQQAEWAVAEVEGIKNVSVDITFDPPWNPEMISEAGKLQLGMDD